MLKQYSLLVIGNPYDGHVIRFICSLKRINPNIRLDVFGERQPDRELSVELKQAVNNIYLTGYSLYFKNVKGISLFENTIKLCHSFHALLKNERYDIVNIQYPTFADRFLLNDLSKIANKIVLTPWGSDVYRISKYQRKVIKKLYDRADYVTGNGLRFTKDFMRIYNIPNEKFQCLSLGNEDIDFFVDNRVFFDTNKAKEHLKINGHYVITCGYNGSPAQKHFEMIDAIFNAKSKLPDNLLLLFPFTYAGSVEYRAQVKNKVREKGFKAYYCEKYLDLKHLLILRQATDMFIHIQTTDANNGSLKQYVWLDKNVINGGWLEYDDIEIGNYKPYYVTPNIESLSETIVKAYQQGPIAVKTEIKTVIEHYGYKYLAPRWNVFFEGIAK